VQPVLIQDKEVDKVEEYKYLGTIFDKTLKIQQNTDAFTKKGSPKNFCPEEIKRFLCTNIYIECIL